MACSKKNDEEQKETPPIKEYAGSLVNPTDLELQDFFENGYNLIRNDVEFNNVENLVNLAALSNLREIKGDLWLNNNRNLMSLDGLENLKTIGGNLKIHGEDYYWVNGKYKLTNLDGLSNLEYVGKSINIIYQSDLINFCGLKKVLGLNINQDFNIRYCYYNPDKEKILNGDCYIEMPVVNINIDPNSTQFINLNVVGGYEYITANPPSRGIIVYRTSVNDFKAFERTCPHDPDACCDENSCSRIVVEEDGLLMKDDCCGSTYLILDGSNVAGPSVERLRQYRTSYNGETLHIYN